MSELPDSERHRLVALQEILTNHTPSPEVAAGIEALRDMAAVFGEQIIYSAPPCRSRSIALTHLEDCVMRAVQAMVLPPDGPNRNGRY